MFHDINKFSQTGRATVSGGIEMNSCKCKSNYPFIEPHKIASKIFFSLHGTRFICFVVEPYSPVGITMHDTVFFSFIPSVELNFTTTFVSWNWNVVQCS